MRQMLLYLLISIPIAARAQISVTPSAPVVRAGETVRFQANVPVTWSLAPGSAGTIDADGTYHAPQQVRAQQSAAGCQLLPNNHIYNTRIDNLPVHPNSEAWMSLIPSGTRLSFSPSWGLNVMTSATPAKMMRFYYTPANDGSIQILDWPDLKRESGFFTSPLAETDRHVVAINRDNCQVYEIYNDYPPGTNQSCPECTAQSGVQYPAMSFGLASGGGVDAAGMFLLPLTLRLDEIRSGAVRHAIRFTLSNAILARSHIWPATANAFLPWGSIPYGARFRLKSSYDISGFSPVAQVLLTQLKQYGMFVTDGGLNFDIQTMTDVTMDPVVMAAFAELRSAGPTAAEFEIVDEAALRVDNLSGEVKHNNGYVAPKDFAVVIATSVDNPLQTTSVSVILQGVTVGVPEPALWIQSGTSRQLTAWVKGTDTTAVTWQMNPPLGTLTPDGLYTAPTVSAPATTTITATSVVDPSATASIAVTVLPPGPIRLDVGSNSDFVDSQGNTWWRDQGSESSITFSNNCSYLPQNPWPDIPDIALYYTQRYSLGDWTYRFAVPNGNYKITAMFGECGTSAPATVRQFHVEANGQIVRRDYDVYAAAGGASKPVALDVPAMVTNGMLDFTLRRLAWPRTTNTPWAPILNALLIEPDSSEPRITIDPPDAGRITAGQRVQFHAVGWYMSNSVTWSIISGPGSIDSSGVYTAPATPVLVDTPVIIRAVSRVDGSKSATATLVLIFGDMAVSPASATVVRGGSLQFSASIGGAPYANVTWSLSPAIGAIKPNGLYTAPDVLSADTAVQVIATSTDDPTKTAIASLTVLAHHPPIRVNAGWNWDFTDAQGRVWSKDYGYSTPSYSYNESVPIAGTTTDMYPLYQSSRYRYTDEDFYYQFSVPNGYYLVTLKFADYTYNEPGHYNFDVRINGATVQRNFDPDAAAGASKTALDRSFEVAVNNKMIRIDFIGHAGGALINGIEITAIGAPGPAGAPGRRVSGESEIRGRTR
ncbi:MAG: malectin domain-containing carbohydrate-binding protein [Bryobacteraceae bacterium]